MNRYDSAEKQIVDEKSNSKNRRIDNIIWTVSEKYSIKPRNRNIKSNGDIDVYMNMIEGGVYRFLNSSAINKYRNYIFSKYPTSEQINSIFNIVLENSIYSNLIESRPIVSEYRKSYAREIVNSYVDTRYRSFEEQMNYLNSKRILGEVLPAKNLQLDLLNELVKISTFEDKEMILKFHNIVKKYFHFEIRNDEESELISEIENTEETYDGKSELIEDEYTDVYGIESAEFTRNLDTDEQVVKEDENDPINLIKKKFSDRKLEKYIIDNYGISSISMIESKKINDFVCVDSHSGNNLHITRGELPSYMEESYRYRDMNEQRNKNIEYYRDNYSIIHRNINRLQHLINNAIENIDDSDIKTRDGELISQLVWRNSYLKDQKVFNRKSKESKGDIRVDILLDASASQQSRQEIVSSQGYIISSSLVGLKIPVRVWSYSSFEGYTVLKNLKDYDEYDSSRIFGYHASGANRDGLAIRAMSYMCREKSEKNLIIVLSDGKPNDERVSVNLHSSNILQYKDDRAVHDTAIEVRRARYRGATILGVFYGDDRDSFSMKKIYGKNFAHIKSPDDFANVVGIYLKNELWK